MIYRIKTQSELWGQLEIFSQSKNIALSEESKRLLLNYKDKLLGILDLRKLRKSPLYFPL